MKIRKSELKTLIEEVMNEAPARRGVGMDKDTASTKKWMKMADKYYKNIQDAIKRFPHSGNAYTVAKTLKALDVDMTEKSK